MKGKLTQLNLVNEPLLRVLQSHLNCKGSPLLVSVGIPLFKLLDESFMTNIDVPSRWRPALEGAWILATKMTKRLLRISLDRMRRIHGCGPCVFVCTCTFVGVRRVIAKLQHVRSNIMFLTRMLLMKRVLPMQTLLSLGAELKGLATCEDKLGGAVVGTMDSSFWVPCIITGWIGFPRWSSLPTSSIMFSVCGVVEVCRR